jgi:hypothetical protein
MAEARAGAGGQAPSKGVGRLEADRGAEEGAAGGGGALQQTFAQREWRMAPAGGGGREAEGRVKGAG